MPSRPTYASILTPAGRGAVATVAVRGPQAAEFVARRLEITDKQLPLMQDLGLIRLRRFRGLAGSQEELIVVAISPENVEIHCHGGPAAANAVAEALAAEGAQRIDWQQWPELMDDDPIRAEARLALAEARTERTCAILLDQYRGALAAALAQIEELLDAGQKQAAQTRLERLRALAPCGMHLTHPWQVVLAGAPNVGKSSLINALLGYQRAIVFDQPGTTRDVLSAATAIDGWPVELMDTAGLRGPIDSLEAAGIELTRRQLAQADLVLAIEDASLPPAPVTDFPARALAVLNKCDLLSASQRELRLAQIPHACVVSAKTGEGLEQLCGAISRQLVPAIPRPGEAVPFTPRQLDLIESLSATRA
jgi:tRNA modification GTPase